jgi:hypothetical protein
MSSICQRNILQKAFYGAVSDWAKNLQYVSSLVSGTAQINIQKPQTSANLALVEYDLNENSTDNCGVALPNNSSGGATIANPIVGIRLGSCYNYDKGLLYLKFNPNGVAIPNNLTSINNVNPIIIGSIIFSTPTPANDAMVFLSAANVASLASGMMEYLCAVPIYKTVFGNKYINGFNIVLSPQGINAFMLATKTAGAVSTFSVNTVAIAAAAAAGISADTIETALLNITNAIQTSVASFMSSMNTDIQSDSANSSGSAATIFDAATLSSMATSATSNVIPSLQTSTAIIISGMVNIINNAISIITKAISSAYINTPSLPANAATGTQSAISVALNIQTAFNYVYESAPAGITSAVTDVIAAIVDGVLIQSPVSAVYANSITSAVTNAVAAINNAISSAVTANNPTATVATNTATATAIGITAAPLILSLAAAIVNATWLIAEEAVISAQRAAATINTTTTSAGAFPSNINPSSVLVSYEMSYFDRESNVPSTCAVPMPTEASAQTKTASAASGSGYNYLSGNVTTMINNVSTSWPLELKPASANSSQKNC